MRLYVYICIYIYAYIYIIRTHAGFPTSSAISIIQSPPVCTLVSLKKSEGNSFQTHWWLSITVDGLEIMYKPPVWMYKTS